tara:strand:- start:549 stop:767 length:219 start_codon:yes stop_codon:yes gene_type:complete
MKITKRQLRKIIKEQLQEQAPPVSGARQAEAVEQIEAILNELFDDGVSNAGLITLLEGIIRDIGRGYVGAPS